jgi:hypothetical protein
VGRQRTIATTKGRLVGGEIATQAAATGTNNGNPYLDFVLPSGQLAADQSISVTLYFSDPTNQAITYDTQVWQGFRSTQNTGEPLRWRLAFPDMEEVSS